jgi:polysaccharide export outer membrane protein
MQRRDLNEWRGSQCCSSAPNLSHRDPVRLVGLILAAAIVTAACVTGCAPRRAANSAEVTNTATLPPSSPSEGATRVRALWEARTDNGVAADFCVGPGDMLEITVFHWEEMRGLRQRVSATGFISLPLLGELQVAGRTPRQVQDLIAERLRQGIMRNPNVTVLVTEYASQQVSVTGAVARPGLIPLTRDNRTVSDVIAEAGGLSEQAGGKVLFYPARGGMCSGPEARGVRVASAQMPADIAPIEIDLNEQYTPPSENPLLLPVIGGDAITINRGRFLVDGWVARPGAYDISPGITAFGALSAAGGALFAGDLAAVKVWRAERDGTKRRIDVNLNEIASGSQKDVTLQAGDVVQVPASAIKMVPYTGYWIMTNIVRVGAGLSLTGL